MTLSFLSFWGVNMFTSLNLENMLTVTVQAQTPAKADADLTLEGNLIPQEMKKAQARRNP